MVVLISGSTICFHLWQKNDLTASIPLTNYHFKGTFDVCTLHLASAGEI